MNRRHFIAGLLSGAAMPLLPRVAAAVTMDAAPVRFGAWGPACQAGDLVFGAEGWLVWTGTNFSIVRIRDDEE